MRDRGKNRVWFLAIALILAAGLTPTSAQASATVTTYQLNCSSFTASGTSTSPYATIFAHNYSTLDDYFVIVPVVAGSFTGTVSFPEAGTGPYHLQVWGSLNTYTNLNDPGYYDGEEYFNLNRETAPCNVPTLGYGSLALLMAILALAGCFALRRSAA